MEDESDAFSSLLFGAILGEAVLDHLARDAPDVLVDDCTPTSALAVAERAAMPATGLVHFVHEQCVVETMGRRWLAKLPVINETRRGFGLPPAAPPLALLEPMRLVLVACPVRGGMLRGICPYPRRRRGYNLPSHPRHAGSPRVSDRSTPHGSHNRPAGWAGGRGRRPGEPPARYLSMSGMPREAAC
jgi:hypothetical protein